MLLNFTLSGVERNILLVLDYTSHWPVTVVTSV